MSYFPTPSENESISGLYLRYLLLNGFFDSNWKEVFAAQYNYRIRIFPWFLAHSKQKQPILLNKINTNFINYLKSIFSTAEIYNRTPLSLFSTRNPNDYLQVLKTGQRDGHIPCEYEYTSFPAVYCHKCYEAQIMKDGHFSLQTNWQNPFAPYCFIHNCHLSDAKELIRPILNQEIVKPETTTATLQQLCLYKWFEDLRAADLGYIDEHAVHETLIESIRRITSDRTEYANGVYEIYHLIEDIINEMPTDNMALEAFHSTLFKQETIERASRSSFIPSGHFWMITYLGFRSFDNFKAYFSSRFSKRQRLRQKYFQHEENFSEKQLIHSIKTESLETIIGPYAFERLHKSSQPKQ